MRTLIRTNDGSVSVFDESAGQAFHSQHGAWSESEHVYINNGLKYFIAAFPERKVRLLEIGFGTGLNCWLTARMAVEHTLGIEYTGIEKEPLQESIYSKLKYTEDPFFTELHRSTWNELHRKDDWFSYKKIRSDLHDFLTGYSGVKFNVVYFDAFSPNAVPEQWTVTIFQSLRSMMEENSILVTYCAKGEVKRTLLSAGFQLETLAGPPGKREMIRARKMNQAD